MCSAGPSGASPAAAVDSLGIGAAVASLSADELGAMVKSVTRPSTEMQKILAEAWHGDLQVLLTACTALATSALMPNDAAERWGDAVANHHCSVRDGNCFAQLAREEPEKLDALLNRLIEAKQRAADASAIDAAVPTRKLQKLAHRAGSSSTSAVQERAAAAAAVTEAAQEHETPLEAAAAVRQALSQLGCCHAAETCFMAGFAGRSTRFKYRVSKHGKNRSARADARRTLQHVPACADLPALSCCIRGCPRRTSVQDFENWRSRYLAAANPSERASVVKSWGWDPARGRLSGHCDVITYNNQLFGICVRSGVRSAPEAKRPQLRTLRRAGRAPAATGPRSSAQ